MPKRIEHKWIDGIECKRCSKCKEYKPLERFSNSKRYWDGLYQLCSFCNNNGKEPQMLQGNRKNRVKNGIQERKCSVCREWRDVEFFHKRPDGSFYAHCIECDRFRKIRKRYNLSKEQYVDLLINQRYMCKICGDICKDGELLYVDHNHKCCGSNKSCGKCVRGLLCRNCNFAIGYANDNIEVLQSAIEYLQSYQKIEV